MRRALTSLVLVAAVASIGLVAVARQGSQGVQGGPALRVLSVGDLRAFRLPLDRYRLSPAQAEMVDRARNQLFSGCMRRFGFDLAPPAASRQLTVVGNAQRYGVDDEAQAGTHGYHPATPPPATPVREPRLSAAAEAVADGSGPRTYRGRRVPAGGCLRQALRQLGRGGPIPAEPGLAERLDLESYVRTSESGPMRPVFARWSICMGRAGFNYATPREANNDPAWRTPRPSTRELATAVADARCKREVHLVDLWATVETAYQQHQVAQHAEQLEILARALATRVRNAARVAGFGQDNNPPRSSGRIQTARIRSPLVLRRRVGLTVEGEGGAV